MDALTPACRAAVLKALLDEVGAAYKAARDGGDDQLRQLNAQAGADRLEIRVPGVDAPVARLSLSSEATKSVAVNEEAMLAWARTRHPEEVQTIEQVRPAFRTALLDRLVMDADGVVTDPATGERIDWVRPVPAGPRQIRLTFLRRGREAIAEAYRSGGLVLGEVLALTGQEPAQPAEQAP